MELKDLEGRFLRASATFDETKRCADARAGEILASRVGNRETRTSIARWVLLRQRKSMGYSNRMGKKEPRAASSHVWNRRRQRRGILPAFAEATADKMVRAAGFEPATPTV